MRKSAAIADWKRIYESVTNRDKINEQIRVNERQKRKEDKRKDTGL